MLPSNLGFVTFLGARQSRRSVPCFEIESHHYRRSFAGVVFLACKALKPAAVPLKAYHVILLVSIAAIDMIESFAGHPANNACRTVHHRKPDATCEILSRLPDCRQFVNRLLLSRSEVVLDMHGVVSQFRWGEDQDQCRSFSYSYLIPSSSPGAARSCVTYITANFGFR